MSGQLQPSSGEPPVPVPLNRAGPGRWFRVAAVDCGWGATGRLADLGLMVGSEARIVRPSRGGPVLIEVKGSRLAIGHRLARSILVRLLDVVPHARQPAPDAPDGRNCGRWAGPPADRGRGPWSSQAGQ